MIKKQYVSPKCDIVSVIELSHPFLGSITVGKDDYGDGGEWEDDDFNPTV